KGTGTLRARLDDDALDVDNQVTLLPAVNRPVRVAVRVTDKALRGLVEKGLKAARAERVADRPDLLFTDRDGDEPEGDDAWVVRLLAEKEAEAYAGPFVLDRTHPLTEGLSLEGVAWAAGPGTELEGAPVVAAGNVPLLTDREAADGRHELRLRLRPDLSTLPESPAWPILMVNLLQWRAAQAPGLDRANLPLGEAAAV